MGPRNVSPVQAALGYVALMNNMLSCLSREGAASFTRDGLTVCWLQVRIERTLGGMATMAC